MFQVGQKVVCVDASDGPYGPTNLMVGQVYTISGLSDGYDVPGVGIHLYGVTENRNRPNNKGATGYRPTRFRPIVEKKTDISVFEEILRRAPKHLPADIGIEHR